MTDSTNDLGQHFKDEAHDLARQADAIMAAEDKYVYSLIGVAGTVIAFAMYRSTDLTMQPRDVLFVVGIVSLLLSFLGGYLNRGGQIARAKSRFWSQAAKLVTQAEEIVSATNPRVEDGKKMMADFVREYIDKPGERAFKSAQFWFDVQPYLLVFGAVCIFLWVATVKMA